MKKWQRPIMVLMAAVFAFAMVGCDRDKGEKVDKDRTQIYINYYNGGLGARWMNDLKKSYEAIHPEIQIMPVPGKSTLDAGTVLNDFDNYDGDLFFLDYVGSEYLTQFRTEGHIADISKYVKEQNIPGENGTIWQKTAPAIRDYFDIDGKVYALPWYQASYQMIYDIELFESQSLYKDPAGNWNDGSNKSVGQDGIANTYDDGLPVTRSEFFALLDHMVEKNIIPLTFFGSQAYYFSSFLTNMFADYEGMNDFMLNYVIEGTDSDLGAIKLEDGWKLKNGQKGKRYALEYTRDLIANSSYYSANTFQTSHDNFAAQNEFLLSKESKGKRIAMLVDGPWWEREASATMNDMADVYKNPDYAYGKREFGIMPIPEADANDPNYRSAEGNTVACTSGRSVIFMNANSKVKDEAGAFLQYCMSEEGLRIATVASGIMRPYDYTMREEDLAQMTTFGRMTYDLNHSANVVFEEVPVHPFLQNEGASYCSYLRTWVSSVETPANVASYFQPGQSGHTVEAYLKGMAEGETKWKNSVYAYEDRLAESENK